MQVYIPLIFYLKSSVLCSPHCEIVIFSKINQILSSHHLLYLRLNGTVFQNWNCDFELLENQLLPNLMQHELKTALKTLVRLFAAFQTGVRFAKHSASRNLHLGTRGGTADSLTCPCEL